MTTIEDRFWMKVNRDGGIPRHRPGLGQCWVWTGAIAGGTGYGLLRVRPKTVGAHRLAWEIQRGPIPAGMFVLHHCDNRACVRIEHLFLGTHADNMADRERKGRTVTNGMERRTHCKNGHEFTENNLYRAPSVVGRACLRCREEKTAARKVAVRA